MLPAYESSRFHQIYFTFHRIFRTTGKNNSNSDEFLPGGGGLTVKYNVANLVPSVRHNFQVRILYWRSVVCLSQQLTNLMHKIFVLQEVYFMPLHVSSTCIRHQVVKIALHSLWYHHTWYRKTKETLHVSSTPWCLYESQPTQWAVGSQEQALYIKAAVTDLSCRQTSTMLQQEHNWTLPASLPLQRLCVKKVQYCVYF